MLREDIRMFARVIIAFSSFVGVGGAVTYYMERLKLFQY
jgi:hypothetical protein